MTAADDTDAMWLANLHDVFLNANYMRTLMESAPVPDDPSEWTMSTRGRLERFWHRDLYVLVEAWRRMSAKRHARFREWAPEAYDELVALLSESDVQACIEHLHATRNYMSHRDQRKYWDPGRVAPAQAGLVLPRRLNSALGKYLLLALHRHAAE